MSKRCEELFICKANYKDDSEYKIAIANTISTLLTNDYIVVVKQEMSDFVILEYNLDDVGASGYSLEWVADDEYIEKYDNGSAEESDEVPFV